MQSSCLELLILLIRCPLSPIVIKCPVLTIITPRFASLHYQIKRTEMTHNEPAFSNLLSRRKKNPHFPSRPEGGIFASSRVVENQYRVDLAKPLQRKYSDVQWKTLYVLKVAWRVVPLGESWHDNAAISCAVIGLWAGSSWGGWSVVGGMSLSQLKLCTWMKLVISK